ncbi:MAG: hypothetical protein JNJ89_17400 [Rubrivivax sp.]|nr:hypothetical protein [Rubrivivax sp.]
MLAWALVAQGVWAGPAAQPLPANAQAASAAAAGSGLRVIEDDRVRIEETRVRGQVQRITVAPKGPVGSSPRPYEIQVGAGGRDPSQDRSSAGQRVWSVLKF